MTDIKIDFPFNELETRFRAIVCEVVTSLLPKTNEPEQLISMDEVRKMFTPSVSKPTIIQWTKDGKLQSHRIGGRVYYKRSEVSESLKTVKKYGR